jgi:hypothetical protein
MAVELAPGFYREEVCDVAVLYVDEDRTLWLVDTADDADLPWRLEDEQALGVQPYPNIPPEDAAKYRRMVDQVTGPEAGRTCR